MPTDPTLGIFRIRLIDGRPDFFVEAAEPHEAIAKAKEIALIFGSDDGMGFATTEHDPEGKIRQSQLGADRVTPNQGPVTAELVPGAVILEEGPDGTKRPQETALAIRHEMHALVKREMGERLDGFRDTLVSQFQRLEAGLGDAPIIPQVEMWDALLTQAEAKAESAGLTVDFQLGTLGRWFREYRLWLTKMRGNLQAVQKRLSNS